MNDTIIVHGRKRKSKKRPYSNPQKITVKLPHFVCPVSREETSFRDSRVCFFSVHDRRVPVNGQAFLDFCVSANWPVPKLSDDFDIKAFLEEQARRLSTIPIDKDIGQRWGQLLAFADTIGLKSGFSYVIRRAT